jgi:transcription factor C subunit 7
MVSDKIAALLYPAMWTNVDVTPSVGLSEWYSPVEPGTGLHPRPGSPASLQKYFPTVSTAWSPLLYPSRRGEEVETIHERTTILLNALIPVAAAQGHKRMVLVTHAATAIALVRSLLRDPRFPIRVGCCAISELRSVSPQGNGLTPDGGMGDWKAVKLADGAHLAQGASRDWGFEDIEIAHGKVCYCFTPELLLGFYSATT